MSWLPGMNPPLQTSEGAIKIQLQAALSALGQERMDLTHDQQNQLTACLETDSVNIDVVARLLRQLIRFDYPKIDTRSLTDEQFIIAGSATTVVRRARCGTSFSHCRTHPENQPANILRTVGRCSGTAPRSGQSWGCSMPLRRSLALSVTLLYAAAVGVAIVVLSGSPYDS